MKFSIIALILVIICIGVIAVSTKLKAEKLEECILRSKGQSAHSSGAKVSRSPRPGDWFALPNYGSGAIG